MADRTRNRVDEQAMTYELVKPSEKEIAAEASRRFADCAKDAATYQRWRADQLAAAVKIFNGAPPKPIMDTSPNHGSGWMGKRR